MKMFADYIKERENKECLYSAKGFATFLFEKETCYIENIYVKPEFRKEGEASRLADEIADIAAKKGCKLLMGSVSPLANGSTDSLKVLLAYGFKLVSSTNNFIILSKEIGAK